MKTARLVLIIAGLFCASCASLRPTPVAEPASAPTRFLAYRVVHIGVDHLALEILYTYDGAHGEDGVFIGAISTSKGQSTGHWGYRPDPLIPGTHWGRVRLGLNDTAPLLHRTDGLELSMYRGGGSQFHEVNVPFRKTWFRLPTILQGHRRWGAGCGG